MGAPMSYVPLAERMRAFFEANPLEELTLEDMVIKFDATLGTVKNAVTDLKAAGVIDRVIVFRKVEGS